MFACLLWEVDVAVISAVQTSGSVWPLCQCKLSCQKLNTKFSAVSTVQGPRFAGVSWHNGLLLFNVLFRFKSALLDLGVTDHFTEEG